MFFRPSSLPLDLILGNPYTFGRPHSHWQWYLSDEEENSSNASDTGKNKTNKKPVSKPVTYTNAAASVKEHEDHYTLTLDVPGVKGSDIDIQVENGVLRLVAERKSGNTVVCKYVQHFMVYERDVQTDKIHASLSDGVLTLTVPKKEEAAPVTIAVQAVEVPDLNDDKVLSLTMDCPGFRPDHLNIAFHKGHLTVQGATKTRKINRKMALNETKVNVKTLQAYLMDGVLTITMERCDQEEQNKPKQVTVSPGAPKQIAVDAGNNKKVDGAKAVQTNNKEKTIVVETAKDDDVDSDNANPFDLQSVTKSVSSRTHLVTLQRCHDGMLRCRVGSLLC